MNHEQYDAIADWLQAHYWAKTLNIYVGSYALSFALIMGIFDDRSWFGLLPVVVACFLIWRVADHGFLRHLDRKYPSVAELPCTDEGRLVALDFHWDAA